MEIEYKGANAVIIKSGSAVVVVDPKLSLVGLRDVSIKDTIQLATNKRFMIEDSPKITIDGPGEYEIANISIKGVAAKQHIDDAGKAGTIYRVTAGGYRIAIIGHIDPTLDEDQFEAIGIIDIAIIPVGGNGYTLDGHAAASIIKHIDPKVVIPTHYEDKAIQYEVPQQDLASFRKELGAVSFETVTKYKLKSGSALAETLTLVELVRT